MMIKVLKDKLVEKSLIGIRTIYQEWDEVIIGFIKSIEGNNLILQEIDEYGKTLGETNIEIVDILSVEFDDKYQIKLMSILENSDLFESENQVTIWSKAKELKIVVLELIEKDIIATLFFDEDFFITGKILEFQDNYIFVNNITSSGEDDGYSIHLIDKLIGIRYNGKEELKIRYLLEKLK
jgi:hypothetical protein